MILRKRPSSNSSMSLLNRAFTSGTEKRGAVSQRAKKITPPGETSTPRADAIMDEIRSLGFYPKEHGATRQLARKRRMAEAAGEFSISQLAELKTLKEQEDEKARTVQGELLMRGDSFTLFALSASQNLQL